MRRTRKIFLGHAGELAHRLLRSLDEEGLVGRFVDSYAEEFNRPGLTEHPVRHRELLGTLGRETLLAMVAQVNAELPRYLGPRRHMVLSGPEVQLAEAFREEFLEALARAQNWSPADAEEFRRDLALCSQMTARTQAVKKRRKATDPPEGPFVDRCALLLDPSMLDVGRRAAGKFLVEIERLTGATLRRLFRSRR